MWQGTKRRRAWRKSVPHLHESCSTRWIIISYRIARVLLIEPYRVLSSRIVCYHNVSYAILPYRLLRTVSLHIVYYRNLTIPYRMIWIGQTIIKNSGPIIPDNQKPTVPPNDNCDYGWHYFGSTQKCYLHTTDEKAWKAAQQTCEGYGGHLASINSPVMQEELLAFAGLDPTALGK